MDVGMQHRRLVGGRLLAVVAILSLSLGCDDDDEKPDGGGGSGRDGGSIVDSGRSDGDSSVPVLTEAEVAGVVNAMNDAELTFAQSVESRLVDADVAALAAQVIATHTTLVAEHESLLEALGITPEESALSASISKHGMDLADSLALLSGEQLDRAYIDAQIILDAELLAEIQETVIPSTTNSHYRTFLFDMREVLFTNLQAGRALDDDEEPVDPEPEPDAGADPDAGTDPDAGADSDPDAGV